MIAPIGPHVSEVHTVVTAPRKTPTPASARFSEVLAVQAGSLVRGAEATVRSLPGAPLMALALRAPATLAGAPSLPTVRGLAAPSVSGSSSAAPAAGGAGAAEGPGGTAGTAAPGGAGIEASLSESQEMNLYFLRIQEAMNAQNRTYSALSNVLKAQHDTVKNAISNIR